MITMTARTKNAWTHRAVLVTAEDVDRELRTCATIERQNGFSKGVKLDLANHYKWPWVNVLARDIKPLGNTFEYIDGTFRPNTKRILSLLGGTELYGTPLASVRELLQNAFDAVSEQIAHEALTKVGVEPAIACTSLASLHNITLTLELNPDGTWLSCSDSGSGMTRRVIERYLLVSGSNQRPELLEVARQCADRGMPFIRSGEFGVGVLSYFMLADKLIIETRASVEAHSDAEQHGWRFETEGLDSFGELRSIAIATHGSSVRLRLKDEFTSPEFETELLRYFRSIVTKTPCVLNLNLPSTQSRILPGWTRTSDFVIKAGTATLRDDGVSRWSDIKSHRLKSAETETKRIWDRLRQRADDTIRFIGPYSGVLPNNNGTFRVHFVYYALDRGASLAFFDIDGNIISAFPDGKAGYYPSGANIFSWRKFRTGGNASSGIYFGPTSSTRNMIIELDLENNGSISLNWSHLDIVDSKSIDDFIISEHRSGLARLYAELGASRFVDFDSGCSTFLRANINDAESYWAFCEPFIADQESPNRWTWRGIQFPAILIPTAVTKYTGLLGNTKVRAMGFQDELRPIRNDYDDMKYPIAGVSPTRLVLYHGDYRNDIAFVYDNNRNIDVVKPPSVRFPKEWKDVISIEFERFIIYNRDNPIFEMITNEFWIRYYDDVSAADLKTCITNAVRLGYEAAAMFIICNCGEFTEFWDALHDNFRDEFERIFELVGIRDSNQFVILWKANYREGLRKISRTGTTFAAGNPVAEGGPLHLNRGRNDEFFV